MKYTITKVIVKREDNSVYNMFSLQSSIIELVLSNHEQLELHARAMFSLPTNKNIMTLVYNKSIKFNRQNFESDTPFNTLLHNKAITRKMTRGKIKLLKTWVKLHMYSIDLLVTGYIVGSVTIHKNAHNVWILSTLDGYSLSKFDTFKEAIKYASFLSEAHNWALYPDVYNFSASLKDHVTYDVQSANGVLNGLGTTFKLGRNLIHPKLLKHYKAIKLAAYNLKKHKELHGFIKSSQLTTLKLYVQLYKEVNNEIS